MRNGRIADEQRASPAAIFARQKLVVLMATLVSIGLMTGCHPFRERGPGAPRPPRPVEVPISNPARIPNMDPDFLWEQIVDSVDDYFRIQSEQRVRSTATLRQEGILVTFPEVSGTSLEPWRRDTSLGFERLQSTILTIRRTATVRVIAEDSGYSIDVQIIKEQEDVDQSQFATAGSSAQRHDGTIVRNENQLRQLPITLGWFEIGRDRQLEQRILQEIMGRITNVGPPRNKLLQLR